MNNIDIIKNINKYITYKLKSIIDLLEFIYLFLYSKIF